MPEFSFSPQEYITQIGQYLMTLPQHLEPYMTNENPALARAFQVYARAFGYFSAIFWANILQTETCIAVKDNIVVIFWSNSVFF